MAAERIECKQFKIQRLDELKPHPENRNKHPEKQIEVLAKIIARNGQRSPIVCSNLSGYIVKGHGRYEALMLLGWQEAAVEWQDYKDEAEELRDRIADNEIARYSEFDKMGFVDDVRDFESLDFEEFGLLNFEFSMVPEVEIDDEPGEAIEVKKYVLEVQFPNELELADVHDDLLHRGYLVRKK